VDSDQEEHMSYVAAVTVQLNDQIPQEQRERMLREVLLPRLQSLSGFRSARFLRSTDGTTGIGAVRFDTEGEAKAGLDVLTTDRPAEAPQIVSAAVYEVFLEA
jgi:hypothetical protein